MSNPTKYYKRNDNDQYPTFYRSYNPSTYRRQYGSQASSHAHYSNNMVSGMPNPTRKPRNGSNEQRISKNVHKWEPYLAKAMAKSQIAGRETKKDQTHLRGKVDGRKYADVVKMDRYEANFPALPARKIQLQERPMVSSNIPSATLGDLGPKGPEQLWNQAKPPHTYTKYTHNDYNHIYNDYEHNINLPLTLTLLSKLHKKKAQVGVAAKKVEIPTSTPPAGTTAVPSNLQATESCHPTTEKIVVEDSTYLVSTPTGSGIAGGSKPPGSFLSDRNTDGVDDTLCREAIYLCGFTGAKQGRSRRSVPKKKKIYVDDNFEEAMKSLPANKERSDTSKDISDFDKSIEELLKLHRKELLERIPKRKAKPINHRDMLKRQEEYPFSKEKK